MIKADMTPYKLSAHFMDGDQARTQYTDDRRYYEQLVAKHGHLSGLNFKPVQLSQEQSERLAEIAGADIEAYLADAADYVRLGIVSPDNEAPFLSQIAADDDVKEATLAHHKSLAMDAARRIRWQVESGGTAVTLEDGQQLALRTDERSQQRVASLVTTVLADPESVSVDFEYAPGQWMEISRYDAIEIGKAVSGHVQRCFSACRAVHGAIAGVQLAGSLGEALDSLEGIDLQLEWDAAYG